MRSFLTVLSSSFFGATVALSIVPSISFAADTKTDVPQLVVVGSSLPTETYKLGNAISVLEADDIQKLGYQYAVDLLRVIPGVAVSRTGGYGGLTQVRMRGAEGNHVLVLIDGINVSAAGSGEFDFSSLLSADIERIEVLRGPQSGLYGSNALAGVISIHTKTAETGVAIEGELEAGSYDTQSGGVSLTGGNEIVKGRISVINRRSEFDISEDDTFGPEDDSDKNTTISGQLNWYVNESLSFDFYGRRAEKDTETDGFDFSGGALQGLTFDDESFSNTSDQTLGGTATLELADGRSVSRVSLVKTDNETDGGTYGSESSRAQVNINTSWVWGQTGSLGQRSTLFAEHKKETYRNTMPIDPSQIPKQERELLGFGLEHRLDIGERIFLAGTIRQDDNDDFEDETTYSVNGSYRFLESGTRLHGSFGRGVTNPTFSEQFGYTPGMFEGNPALTPEESIGWDIGIEQMLFQNTLIVDLTWFDANLKNEIQSSYPTVVNDEDKSTRRGVEMSLDYMPSERTTINFAYTYTDAEEDGGEREVRRPRNTASFYATQYLSDQFFIAGSVIYNGKQLDNDYRNYYTNNFAAERTEVASYTLVNLNAGYNVTPELMIYARVENVLDEQYEEVISYATPGRAVYAGMRFHFGS